VVAELDAFVSAIRPPVGLEDRIRALAVGAPGPRLRLMPPPGAGASSPDAGSSSGWVSRPTVGPSRLLRLGGIAAALLVGAVGVGLLSGRLPMGIQVGGAPVPPGTPIDWDNGAVQLSADGLTIMADDVAYVTPQEPDSIAPYSGSPVDRELQVVWFQDGIEMRLSFYLVADQERWWVDQIRTYGGFPNPGGHSWLEYDGSPIGAALGEAWEGDLDLSADVGEVPGRLVGHGVRMTAWVPGSVAGVHGGCSLPGAGKAGHDALAPGEPLRGSGILDMTPPQARDLLQARGLCHAFNTEYEVTDGEATWTEGETWCTPPKGRIEAVRYGGWGQVWVTVIERPTQPARTPGESQPAVGYGCPWPPAIPDPIETPLVSPG
jgi:hypothetical protein